MITKSTARVGVLMGGLSAERAISLRSGEGVFNALLSRGWNAVAIDVDRQLPERLRAESVNVAWVALHGRFGEDGCVQGLLEVMGIPYTGSGVRASAVAMDKIATKRSLRDVSQVVMARDEVWSQGEPLPKLSFPCIIKPAGCGSTIGIQRVNDASQLESSLNAALKFGEQILVEEFIEGDEITVSVMDGRALPIVRIIPESGFFDFEAKYTQGKTRYECPAALDAQTTALAQQAAVAAYKNLGCRGLARADFIVRRDHQPVFLEINTSPGFTPTSLSPKAAAVEGISYPELVEQILMGAVVLSTEI